MSELKKDTQPLSKVYPLYDIPVEMYLESRAKLFSRFHSMKDLIKNSAIVLEGGKPAFRHDTDHELLFRQESNFYYIFGANEPDLYGVLDIEKKESILFVPRTDITYEMWCGKPKPSSHYKKVLGVDHVHYVDELASVLKQRGITNLYLLQGFNSDSKATSKPANFEGIDAFQVEKTKLHEHITECRVTKSDKELDLMRFVNSVSSEAHKQVMRSCKVGMYEYQLESIFLHECHFKGGCRYQAYTCICCSGYNGAVLHYGHAAAPNDKVIGESEMLLLDMGVEYQGYASDITCSFPSNGKFTDDQRAVYEGVLDAQLEVMKAMKPGVQWVDMHRLALRTIAKHLLQIGILQNGSIDELMKNHVPAVFMPHGLGHLLGLDTHDVGGYPSGTERVDEPSTRNLRCNRPLEKGMVLTVEPGIYFIDALIEQALLKENTRKYINSDVLARFRKFGGVRLEDNVVVTQDGCENLTKCPRTVKQVETWMLTGNM